MDKKKLDLDELFRLAKEDPEGFEELRARLIEETINSASPENIPRLRGEQWRIDCERKTFKGDQLHFASYLFGRAFTRLMDLRPHLYSLQTSLSVMGNANKPRLTIVKCGKEE